jgi:hypothetical protein
MARRSLLKVADVLAAHPIVDQTVPLGVTVAYLVWLDSFTPIGLETRVSFYVGVSTLAALAVAAATFVCTLTYQSASDHMTAVRKHYGGELRRNWTSIILSTLVAATLPLLSILADSRSIYVAVAMTVYALALVVVRFCRSVYWLRLTLFMEIVSNATPEKIVVKLPRRAS